MPQNKQFLDILFLSIKQFNLINDLCPFFSSKQNNVFN